MTKRRKSTMKVTAVRFGDDLRRLLEHESALVGVSVSQYVREAALARAAAAVAARGESPFERLAGAVHETVAIVPDDGPEGHEALAVLARATSPGEPDAAPRIAGEGARSGA